MDIKKQKYSNSMNDIKITSIRKEEAINNVEEKDRDEKMKDFLNENNQQMNDPIFIPTDSQYKPKGLMKILGYMAAFLLIFLVGGLGGIWMEHMVIPKLSLQEPFNKYAFFKSINDRTNIINNTNNVIISDDSALLESVRKVNPSIVKITANYVFKEKLSAYQIKVGVKPKTAIENRNLSGVIITADGMILTRDPQNFQIDLKKNDFTEVNYTVSYNEKEYTVSGMENIIFYDAFDKNFKGTEKGNMVILKIEAENLPVIALGESINAEVGVKVVALGNNIFSGIISERGEKGIISIDNKPSGTYFGSGPLVDSKGKMIGINIIGSNDQSSGSFIGVDEFKDFIRQVIGS